MFESTGNHDGTDFTFTRTAKFTEAGLGVTGDDNAALFAEGGDLYVASSDLPEYLSTSFAPAAPTGWDCEDVDETIELDPDSAGHRACDGDRDDEQSPDCWGDEFENGQNAE